MEIQPVLEQFGLKPREIKVYLACLELGLTSVLEIAKKTSLKRPTVYDILEVLKSKGLVSQSVKGKKRFFFAEEPEKLTKLIEEKRVMLEQIMPALKSMHNVAGSKPVIRYYEGQDGLRQVYRDTLNYQGELVAFVTENIIQKLGKRFADEYIQKRKKAKITVRVIGPDTDEIKEYKKTDRQYLKKTRMVDQKKFPFTIEMNVYGNKLAFMSFKEEMGIIIESNEIANNMKLLFELAWQGTK